MTAHGSLVWIDTETTGLDPEHDALLEVACIITDADLNIVGTPVSCVIRPESWEVLNRLDEDVWQMHWGSGLYDALPGGCPLAEAEAWIVAYVAENLDGRVPLAGSSVHFDRAVLRQNMPGLGFALTHRNVDVSTVKELASRWAPDVFASRPTPTGNHRALGDLHDSIAELAHYRKHMAAFTPAAAS
ncbi:MAG: oligoribonuclease [Actinomycetota bacterium]|nr:oligoribonuclease [Actinomycetota bacterium]